MKRFWEWVRNIAASIAILLFVKSWRDNMKTIRLFWDSLTAWQFMFFLVLLTAIFALWRWRLKVIEDNIKETKTLKNIPANHPNKDINSLILFQMIKFRSLNQKATPLNIAGKLKQDTGIILAHLIKLHNDKFVTFQTGGLPPALDTDFFLSVNDEDFQRIINQ